MKNASAVSPEEALKPATVNGYAALGFGGGEIKEGNFADMVLVDLSAPFMRPLSNLRKNIVYSADSSAVLMTVAGGKIVYENGEYRIGEPLEKIYAECEKRVKRLLSEANFS